jgi:hypothetical protein
LEDLSLHRIQLMDRSKQYSHQLILEFDQLLAIIFMFEVPALICCRTCFAIPRVVA